jgi:hypothetical protein
LGLPYLWGRKGGLLDRLTDPAPLVQHLAEGDEAGIRRREAGRRDGEAAHEADPEAGPLDEPRRERVEAARHDVQLLLAEQRAGTPPITLV